jgi:hypothetical protein
MEAAVTKSLRSFHCSSEPCAEKSENCFPACFEYWHQLLPEYYLPEFEPGNPSQQSPSETYLPQSRKYKRRP